MNLSLRITCVSVALVVTSSDVMEQGLVRRQKSRCRSNDAFTTAQDDRLWQNGDWHRLYCDVMVCLLWSRVGL